MTTRTLTSSPSVLPMYLKAVVPAIPVIGALPGVRRSGGSLPDVELVQAGVRVSAARLAAYAEVCGFGVPLALPPTYPHVLAFPLQMAMLTDRSFPFAPMGMVHVENRITQRRPIGVDEVLEMRVQPTNLRPHAKGQQFDFLSEARAAGEVVWEEASTYLRRGPSASAPESALSSVDPPAGATRWRLPGDLGRRYASVSGDRNPIHLYGVTAKAFGFQRQIAHGMWSKARCVAALAPRLPDAFEVAVAFKKPVLLPTTVSFGARAEDSGWVFGLRDAGKSVAHLVGTVRPI
jgi:acyl dehydratase